jgi:hypothetical protein
MKFTTISKTLTLGIAVLFAATAFAANEGNLQITHPVNVNGTTLKAGDYKVKWDGSGPNVEVSIVQGKKVLAKTSAHVVDMNSAADRDAAVTHDNGDGSSSLAGVRFQGKKFTLELGQSSDSMQSGSSK